MSGAQAIQSFALKVDRNLAAIFVGAATDVFNGVVFGSPVTGSPGQPVDTGNLRASWQLRFISEHEAQVSTNVEYAPAIEDGIGPHGPMTLRSGVGGFHSVKSVRANFDRLLADVASRVVG